MVRNRFPTGFASRPDPASYEIAEAPGKHARGLEQHEIASKKTALRKRLFDGCEKRFGNGPLVAEHVGVLDLAGARCEHL